jgi:hypothetical protein
MNTVLMEMHIITGNADWASAFMPWNGSTITFNPTVMYHWYYAHILYLYIIPLRT